MVLMVIRKVSSGSILIVRLFIEMLVVLIVLVDSF